MDLLVSAFKESLGEVFNYLDKQAEEKIRKTERPPPPAPPKPFSPEIYDRVETMIQPYFPGHKVYVQRSSEPSYVLDFPPAFNRVWVTVHGDCPEDIFPLIQDWKEKRREFPSIAVIFSNGDEWESYFCLNLHGWLGDPRFDRKENA